MAPKSVASTSKLNPSTPKSSNPSNPPAPSPTRVSVSAATQRLTGKLQEVRANLIENIEQSWYLGENSGRDRVVWYRMGKEHLLLTKESATALDVERAKHASSEDDDTASEAASLEPSPALLSAVITITPEDFWMMSCGRWKGPTNICREFADMKLSCTGGEPEDDIFRGDFQTAISNINHLMSTSATHGFTSKKGVLIPAGTSQKIKLRHILFEPSNVSETEGRGGGEDDSDGSDIPEAFRIQNWPTVNDEAQLALQEMITTHRVVPIPAYDIQGHLILPSQYKKQLEGATVQVHFTLKHWSIAGRNGAPSADTYVADVVSMRILIPPKAPMSPAKRRFFATDPMSSPTKKNRPD